MFVKMLCVLVVGVATVKPEPAAFKVLLVPDDAPVTVKMDGLTLKPGVLYVTEPLLGETEVELVFTWTTPDGKESRRVTRVTLRAGYTTVVKFAVPKDWVSLAPDGA